jgi:hypothetical protein
MDTSRSSFLTLGALAGFALAAGGGIYRATHGSSHQCFVLDGEARAALDAIVPAVLAGALPAEPEQRAAIIGAAITRVHDAILGLPLGTQKEVQDLFGLLALAPARRFLAGVSGDWSEADPAHVEAFLQDWRVSRFELLRSAYQAIHNLVYGAWYADPSSWAAIGYLGPLPELT